jgi:hypothetical protein
MLEQPVPKRRVEKLLGGNVGVLVSPGPMSLDYMTALGTNLSGAPGQPGSTRVYTASSVQP